MQIPNESIPSTPVVVPGALVSRRETVISCNVAEETVLLDLNSGVYFGLDPVGTRIWALIQMPRTANDVRDALMKEYDVDAPTCEAAVLQFVNHMAAKGLVTLSGM